MNFEFPTPKKRGPASRRWPLPWSDPPEGEVGMPVGYRFRFTQPALAQLTVGEFVAYSTGVEFETVATLVMSDPPDNRLELDDLRTRLLSGLAVEIILPDGTVVSARSSGSPATEPQPPALTRLWHGRGGGRAHWTQRDTWYLWQPPVAGTLTFVCRWPEVGIDERVHEVEAERIRSASQQALRFWRQ